MCFKSHILFLFFEQVHPLYGRVSNYSYSGQCAVSAHLSHAHVWSRRLWARSEVSSLIIVNLKVSRDSDTDIQQFWLDNKSMLPKLYAVARKVLCVPASSAASERVFSTAGRLLEKKRTSLAPSSVDSLLFLHSNMQWELKLILMFDWLRILNRVSFGW